MQSSRLYAAAGRRVTRLRTLTRLNQLISSSLDANELIGEITRAAAFIMEAPLASFWRADERERTLEVTAFSDVEQGEDFPSPRIAYGEGPSAGPRSGGSRSSSTTSSRMVGS